MSDTNGSPPSQNQSIHVDDKFLAMALETALVEARNKCIVQQALIFQLQKERDEQQHLITLLTERIEALEDSQFQRSEQEELDYAPAGG